MNINDDSNILKRLADVKRLYRYYGESSVKQIRFSCAYLFRIKVDGRYFLVRDEQRRNHFQPVGGVYKYLDKNILNIFNAEQCRKFRYTSDLDDDLRILVPRRNAQKFYKWYNRQTDRETIKNLYREFKEEIIERIVMSPQEISAFKKIKYEYRGENIVASTYKNEIGEKTLQLHFADIVELLPTEKQLNAFRSLQKRDSLIYYFATEAEILKANESTNFIQSDNLSISNHSYKILSSEEKNLKIVKNKKGVYTAFNEESEFKGVLEKLNEYQSKLKVCYENKPFIFISYNSVDKLAVFATCVSPPINKENIWIDKKNVTENWKDNVEAILSNTNCKLSVIFINEDYLKRSSACLDEAKIIVEKEIPHIIYLLNLNIADVTDLIKKWISNDFADKTRLKIFKKLFSYNDDTGHIDNSVVEIIDYLPIDHTHFLNFINKKFHT
jgi:hypothetical protein